MNKFSVITGGIFLLIFCYFLLGVLSDVMYNINQAMNPIIQQVQDSGMTYLTSWIPVYQFTWNYTPVLVLGAILIWMYLAANQIDVEENFKGGGL